MTLRVLVMCDGTREDRPSMALESCRAFLPVEPRVLPTSQTIDPDAAIDDAERAGWTTTAAGRDLCPACSRSRHALDVQRVLVAATPAPAPWLLPDGCAHSSTPHMIDGARRCPDCGEPTS